MGADAVRRREARQILQTERERVTALVGDLACGRDRRWIPGEQARHLRAVFEVELGIWPQQMFGLVEFGVVANADQHILQAVLLALGVVDVIGRDVTDADLFG